jgi:cell division protein FtsL
MLFLNTGRLNRLTSLSLFLLVTMLATAYLVVEPVYAQFDFNAFLGNPIPDEEIDGILGSEWDDAGNHPDINIQPQTTAEIWTKHDETYLYIAMQFIADSANPWVAFQFDFTSHMSSGADGALFGHDRLGPNEYRDISFGGLGSISSDAIQDGMGAISVGDSNFITVELKKPLSSGDSAGDDIEWTVDNTYTLVIRWDSNGGGSSGGGSSHLSGSVEHRTVFINTNEIPEFSVLSLLIVLTLTAILVIILKRRTDLQISKKALLNHTDRKNA